MDVPPLDTVPYWDGTEALAVDGNGHFASLQAISDFCCEDNQAVLALGATADGTIGWRAQQRGFGLSNSALLQPGDPTSNKTSLLTPDGNIATVGIAFRGDDQSAPGSELSQRIMTVKRSSSDGHLLWRAVADVGLQQCQPSSIASDAQGDIVVAGNCDDAPVTFKYRGSDGALLWSGLETDTCTYASVYSLAVAADGSVYASGLCEYDSAPSDQMTVKYAGDSGAVVWIRHTEGESAGISGSPMFVALTGDKVVLAASAALAANTSRVVVTSLQARDGSPVWSQHFDPPANASLRAQALAVFPNGDLFVSGAATAWRLGAASGNVIWSNSSVAQFQAMAQDSGNDLYLVDGGQLRRLNGASGTPAWTVQADPGAVFGDVALAADGSVLATGSAGTNGEHLYVAAFDAANGHELWSVTDALVVFDAGVGVLPAPDGGVLVSADHGEGDAYPGWTLLHVDAPGADEIFVNGMEE